MSAFFAIAIDSFPVNDSGKLPLSYVLKYMRKWTRIFFFQMGFRLSDFVNLQVVTISAAISIPFILVAFNQDQIATWLQVIGKGGAIWWIAIAVMIGTLLSVILTSQLAAGIKIALTVTVVLLALVAGIGKFIYLLVDGTRWPGSSSSRSGGSRSLVSD
jgi:hypothetical protein